MFCTVILTLLLCTQHGHTQPRQDTKRLALWDDSHIAPLKSDFILEKDGKWTLLTNRVSLVRASIMYAYAISNSVAWKGNCDFVIEFPSLAVDSRDELLEFINQACENNGVTIIYESDGRPMFICPEVMKDEDHSKE